ncbi:uncharacterized protein AKAW2_11513S [Aspergillus luchuensis]|uniref:Uncharacterized protein n=1 Tax=Aspergillus kawachii TaxID=1069201 RepID=A0A7R7W155_ASPKA|nr:uncharacterized protein AKAW2_11513S [Aspergillus luchuensis]BCR94467.1 hypothetical protein AKAW2_11513S [Aspergillus luchuensis]
MRHERLGSTGSRQRMVAISVWLVRLAADSDFMSTSEQYESRAVCWASGRLWARRVSPSGCQKEKKSGSSSACPACRQHVRRIFVLPPFHPPFFRIQYFFAKFSFLFELIDLPVFPQSIGEWVPKGSTSLQAHRLLLTFPNLQLPLLRLSPPHGLNATKLFRPLSLA